MRYRWPENTPFSRVVLSVEQEVCPLCQRRLHVCDHRFHRVFSLDGPLELVCKLAHCPDAHKGRETPYKAEELLSYRQAKPPKEEQEAMQRRKVMRQARSRTRRPVLLAELERRYLAAP